MNLIFISVQTHIATRCDVGTKIMPMSISKKHIKVTQSVSTTAGIWIKLINLIFILVGFNGATSTVRSIAS